MDIKILFIVITIGYLLGCIQAAYLIGKLIKKLDIRQHGTNNAGASNALLVLGWKYGALVLLIDVLKAIIAIMIVRYIYSNNKDLIFLLYTAGASVIIGHNFPFYMNFKGGKGTSSLIGMLISIDWRIFVIGFSVLVLLTLITNYLALGTISMMISFCICTIFLNFGTKALIIAILLSLLSVYKHFPNILRIIQHKELGIRKQ